MKKTTLGLVVAIGVTVRVTVAAESHDSSAAVEEGVREPLIVAHRGASGDAPENTLPAFNLAWERNADAIEGDFHLTKDGEIVCIHDADTERTAGVLREVKNSTLSELRELDVGLWRGEQWKGTKIPTIAEVFSALPEYKKIYIEIKIGPEIVPPLLKEIERSNLKKEQVVILSFNSKVIREMKTRAPQFKAFLLCGFRADESGRRTPVLETVLDTLRQIEADGLSSNRDMVTQDFITRVMAEGYEYHVWTINDLERALRFKKWGARSITTDVPERMKF